jgi:riboflavin synthase
MFTGIVETVGKVLRVARETDLVHFTIEAPWANELKPDQSVMHNGTCLTVTEVRERAYTVTAIGETLRCTNLGLLAEGSPVNLERSMRLGDRVDGHLVQGHIDQTGICSNIEDEKGNRLFSFQYEVSSGNISVPKGSITVDGVSLTVVDSGKGVFSVAIIPYTYEHTCFKYYRTGTVVNLEFDIIGKYIARLINRS